MFIIKVCYKLLEHIDAKKTAPNSTKVEKNNINRTFNKIFLRNAQTIYEFLFFKCRTYNKVL